MTSLVVACGESSAGGERAPSADAATSAAPSVQAAPSLQPAPSVQAASGIVVDRVTGTVLWAKDPHARRPPASLTKVMTAIIVLERVSDLDAWCTVPEVVGTELGNVVGLKPGERITVRQALRATIVKSANDACLTLACKVAGSEAAFVRLMNAKARSLGLDDTSFKNSRGKPVAGHYMSADDLARLGRYVMRNARFRDLCGRQTATILWPGHAVVVESRNRLLDYTWGNGIKTGATEASKVCLLGSGTYALRPLIVVTLREPTRDQEEKDAVALFAWADAQYERRLLVGQGELVTTVPLKGGGDVRAVAASSLTQVVRRAATVATTVALLKTTPKAVPAAGTRLGMVVFRADGQTLGRVALVADGLVEP